MRYTYKVRELGKDIVDNKTNEVGKDVGSFRRNASYVF